MRLLRILVIAVAVAMGIQATAQQSDGFVPGLSVGGKAGMTFSRISFYPSVPQTMISGFLIGVTARYVEEKNFGLILEALVEQRGWKETFDETSYQYQRRMTYFQVPFLTHIYFGGRKIHGFFNAGPELSYLISESETANFDTSAYESLEDFPVSNRSNEQLTMETENSFDYGISAGFGMEYFATEKQSITLEGRLYFGLGNIFGASKSDVFSASRGISIQVSLGYNFRMK